MKKKKKKKETTKTYHPVLSGTILLDVKSPVSLRKIESTHFRHFQHHVHHALKTLVGVDMKTSHRHTKQV